MSKPRVFNPAKTGWTVPVNPNDRNVRTAALPKAPGTTLIDPPIAQTDAANRTSPNADVTGLLGRSPKPSVVPNPNGSGPKVTMPPIDVYTLQKRLNTLGYKIPIDGQLGPVTRAAIADAGANRFGPAVADMMRKAGVPFTAKQDTGAFNQRFAGGTPHPPFRPATGQNAALDSAGNDIASQQGVANPVPTYDPTPLDLLNPDVNQTIPLSALNGYGAQIPLSVLNGHYGQINASKALAGAYGKLDPSMLKGGAQPLSPTLANSGAQPIDQGMAAKLADTQFGSAINDAMLAQKVQPLQAAQNLNDIGHWYDMVQAALKTATGRDTAATQAGLTSNDQATQAILSSLGGSANSGSGLVGAAGAQNAGTLAALGATQDQYNADLAPLLANEAAGAKSREAATQSAQALQLAQNLNDLRTQRGGAEAANLMNILQYNNGLAQNQADRLLNIKQYNNNLADTALGRRLNLAQFNLGQGTAKTNAALQLQQFNLGQDMAKTNAGINLRQINNNATNARIQAGIDLQRANNQAGQQNFSNRYGIAQAKEYAAVAGAKVQSSLANIKDKGDIANIPATTRSSLINQGAKLMLDPNDQTKMRVSPAQGFKMAQNYYRGVFSNPQVADYFARTAVALAQGYTAG